jgi:succinate-semialdehyde dehydrogenase / glutarate-semialdehyde dehydrogenase
MNGVGLDPPEGSAPMLETTSRKTKTIDSINPASGEILARFAEHQPDDIDQALALAVKAQRGWAQVPVGERATLLTRAAQVLRSRKERYAGLITLEMGKPIAEAEAEIEKCAWNCDFYAESAEAFLASDPVASNASESLVVFDPLGVVLAIMPWNYPFWQLFRFAAPALVAGNGAVLKHASNVPQCALAIEEVLREAGAPEGLFRTLLIGASAVEGLIDDPRIAAVTLTGSTEVGSLVAGQAGRQIKKQVLELGGSDPFIVLADADVQEAAAVAARARFQNVGQSCIAAKRFIVDESIADAFVDALCTKVEAFVVDDPMKRECNIGPMARANLRDDLHSQVERSVAAGAELRIGGHPLDRPGFFYAPTVLDRVTPDMPAFAEETFGPAAAVIRVRGEEEAIALANTNQYGLGAALWTRDLDKARSLARRIEAGAVFINGMVASDPRLPFGGIKKSGYGRELGIFGIREFTNIKTVWIGPAQDASRVTLSE